MIERSTIDGMTAEQMRETLHAINELDPPEPDENDDPADLELLEEGWNFCHGNVLDVIRAGAA